MPQARCNKLAVYPISVLSISLRSKKSFSHIRQKNTFAYKCFGILAKSTTKPRLQVKPVPLRMNLKPHSERSLNSCERPLRRFYTSSSMLRAIRSTTRVRVRRTASLTVSQNDYSNEQSKPARGRREERKKNLFSSIKVKTFFNAKILKSARRVVPAARICVCVDIIMQSLQIFFWVFFLSGAINRRRFGV